jgi:NO-binding membrane sensor protein with MHYT domain
MLRFSTLLGDVLAMTPLAASWLVCLVCALIGLELLSGRNYGAPAGRIAAAGVVIGAGMWAQPLLADAWPPNVSFPIHALVVSLCVAVLASASGLTVALKYRDARGLMGGGSLLGVGVALGHGVLIFSLRGPADVSYADVPIATAMTLASLLSLALLLVRRRWSGPVSQVVQALCLATAVGGSQALDCAALTPTALQVSELAVPYIAASEMAQIAGTALLALMLGVKLWSMRPLRPATRGRAGRGSSRPAPSPRPAGRALLHPALVRSAAGPAADPEHRDRRAG